MASTGIKEYTLKINGVDVGIKDVTKLEAAVNSLDATVKKSNTTAAASAKTSATKAKALTDEEKAAKKLADTQKKLEQANSAANKAQIEANIALRERTREVTREIQINQLAEGSIAQMGMQLTNLRNEYEDLSAAERNSAEIGGELLKQIRALDTEYKALRESTGNFRDSVGNYGRAVEGLEQLSGKLKEAGDASVGLASSVIGSNRIMGMFGTSTDQVSEGLTTFNNIMIIAVAAQELYTAVTKEGIIADGIAAAVSGTRALQLKAQAAAQALATKGTVAATIAQAAFNIVASANPYVLLALAIVAVVGALFAFSSRTDDAAKKQTVLNQLQEEYLNLLDREAAKIKAVGDERVKQAERALELLQAQGAKTEQIRGAENRLFNERLRNNARLRGFYGEEIANLEKNRKKVEELTETLRRLNVEKIKGAEETYINIDGKLDLKSITPQKIDDAIEAVQTKIDNINRTVDIAVGLKSEQEQLEQEAKVAAAARAKADKDEAERKRKEAAELAKQRRDIEIAAIREADDVRIATTQSEFERNVRTVVAQYDRQIEDLKRRLAEEKNLTARARKEINETISNLDILRYQELDQLRKERAAKELEDVRVLEDAKTALIVGQQERRTAEINIAYDRQVQELEKRLEDEKDLTQVQQDAITDLIVQTNIKRNKELENLNNEALQKNADFQIRTVETTLKTIRDKTGELVARDKDGMQLINVDKTRKNLEAVRSALADYVTGVKTYQTDLTTAYEAATASMDKNSLEYKEATLNYTSAMDDATLKIAAALKEQEQLAKQSKKTQTEYYKELFAKISEYAGLAAEAVTSVFDTWSMGLDFAIENLNEQLDAVNERFDEVQAQREKAVENVEKLEERLQNATGGTAAALRSQLQDAMHARQEAEQEEARLAKEKEKREAEIRKREKQQRRNDLISGIAQGIANTAEGVTKMLSLPWPLNLVMAAVVGAAGAVQVGIMTRQLTKLAKGGKLVGPSHDNGGMRVEGTNIEVEGGEMVVNKTSTAANEGVLNFINDANGPVSLADLAGFYGGDIPTVAPDLNDSAEDRIVDAIKNQPRPVVSVVDIIDAQEQVTTVQDLSGFN